ncbi:mannose-6-phosphate isomerase [Pectobacterium carotovorum]|uniref:mannose-6-phosphate isomerase n=1 Tax=Pectobacterium carotovorum TaxID=554 RepID=UPI0029DC232B|nr:mannose-6-phosphate isomerase [Pectobacterium carotovorum]MDX6917178.1 mannose-6-phosphate isomerase [Pectobacterium carotovorum]
MKKMCNSIQYYAWGSKSALTALYGLDNKDQLPMAELWMGAHPKSSSRIVDENNDVVSLHDWLAQDLSGRLGHQVAHRFGELPFLFKVLCAEQPLSIQVHPGKTAAEQGFARENAAGIPLDVAERNYKDANHKPELVFALTPFQAINGFRPLPEIAALVELVRDAHPAIAAFLQQPDTVGLACLFTALLDMTEERKAQALETLRKVLTEQTGEPWDTIRAIAHVYPSDNGLFSPLLLNVITLKPGEAMFLYAETPHAYLNGVALEVMANSDNVLRAGLTPKYIDIPELVANVRFESSPADRLLTIPEITDHTLSFPIPVDDFAFSVHHLSSESQSLKQDSAAIVFCIEGDARLQSGGEQLKLKSGESCFIPANHAQVTVQGQGRLARVFNPLSM